MPTMFHHETPRLSDSSSSQQKTSRPPIHNPYDKFSQSEFDAWVGDLTLTLRRALGHEDDPPIQEKAEDPLDLLLDSFSDDVRKEEESEYEASDSDSPSETRDAFRKGNAREQSEGFGLASGTADEPIELDLDSDEEEEEVDENVTDIVQHAEDGGNDDLEEEKGYADSDDGGDSDQENVVPIEAREYTVYDEEEEEQYDELFDNDEEERDEDNEEEVAEVLPSQETIAILLDSDEEEENEGDGLQDTDRNSFFDEENHSFEKNTELAQEAGRESLTVPTILADDLYSEQSSPEDGDENETEYLSGVDGSEFGAFLTPGIITPNEFGAGSVASEVNTSQLEPLFLPGSEGDLPVDEEPEFSESIHGEEPPQEPQYEEDAYGYEGPEHPDEEIEEGQNVQGKAQEKEPEEHVDDDEVLIYSPNPRSSPPAQQLLEAEASHNDVDMASDDEILEINLVKSDKVQVSDIIVEEMLELNATALPEEPTPLVADHESEDEEEVVETTILEKDAIQEDTYLMDVDTTAGDGILPELEEAEPTPKPETGAKEPQLQQSSKTLVQTIEVIHEGFISHSSPPHPQEPLEEITHNEHPDVPTMPELATSTPAEQPQSTVDLDSTQGPTSNPQLSFLTTSGPYVPYFQQHSPVQANVSDFSSSANPFAMNYVPPSANTNRLVTQPYHGQQPNFSVFSNPKSVVNEPSLYANPYIPLYLTPAPPVQSQPAQSPAQVNLANDPYPLNLSTPGVDADEETDEESYQDDHEQGTSLSSATDSDKVASSRKVKPTTSAINTDVDRIPGPVFTPVTPISASSPNGEYQSNNTPKSNSKRGTKGPEQKLTNGGSSVHVQTTPTADSPNSLVGSGKVGSGKVDSKATKRRKSNIKSDGSRKSQSTTTSGKGKKSASRSLPTANKGKGKQRDLDRQNSETPSVTSSGASVAAQLIRSSSVDTQQSPTPARLKDFTFPKPAVQQAKPGPMLHNHSKKGTLQHSHRPPNLQTQIQKRSSYGSPVAGPSSQPPPARSANSPVTRSNCRYHKISMPEVEDGPHIFFLVPGCSLTDRELIVEEEIVDHGDANSDDSERMVPDIESLDINAYVVGIIRLLVGPDKEQEVYFLPKHGEERARKMGRKKSTIIYGDSHTATGHPLSASSQTAPTSTSTTNRSGTDYQREMLSPLSSELSSEVEDDEHESAKRTSVQRNSPPAESSDVSVKPQGNGKQPKRKQLGHDAAAYAPDDEESDEEHGSQKKSPTKRAPKRPRTTEASSTQGDADDRQPKKIKTDDGQAKMEVS